MYNVDFFEKLFMLISETVVQVRVNRQIGIIRFGLDRIYSVTRFHHEEDEVYSLKMDLYNPRTKKTDKQSVYIAFTEPTTGVVHVIVYMYILDDGDAFEEFDELIQVGFDGERYDKYLKLKLEHS